MECVDVLLIDDRVKEMNESFTFGICPIRDDDVHIEDFFAEVTIGDDDSKSGLATTHSLPSSHYSNMQTRSSLLYSIAGVTVSLSLGNRAGVVSENDGAMLVLVELEGYLETHVIVTVETYDGSGK